MHNVGIRTWKTTVRWKFLLAGQLVNMVWVGDIVQNVDNETENWPVLPKFRGDLDEIKYEYEANPLPVYTETDKFVEPLDVKATIRGALVEVQFDLHHYCIRSKLQDSFNATMVQILVIQPGKAEPVLSNKRKNVRNGPVCLNPLSAKQKKTTDEDEPVAGSSTERSRTAPNDVNVLEGKQPKQVASQPSAPSDIVSKPGTAQNSGMVTYEITLNREELTGKCDNSTPHSL